MKKKLVLTIFIILTFMFVFVACDSKESSKEEDSLETTKTTETIKTAETTSTEVIIETSTVVQTQPITQPVTLDLISEATNNKVNNADQAQSVLEYVNQYRAEAGVAPLVLNDELSLAASVRATEMLRNNYFDHARPDGRSWSTIFNELGISCSSYGENIAKGYGDAASVSAGWYVSSGHYANMVKDTYGKIGIGVAYISPGNAYWVQLFTN